FMHGALLSYTASSVKNFSRPGVPNGEICSRSNLPESAGRRRGDNDGFAGFHYRLIARFQGLDPAVPASHLGPARFPVATACEPTWRDQAVGGEDGALQGLQKANCPLCSVARIPS